MNQNIKINLFSVKINADTKKRHINYVHKQFHFPVGPFFENMDIVGMLFTVICHCQSDTFCLVTLNLQTVKWWMPTHVYHIIILSLLLYFIFQIAQWIQLFSSAAHCWILSVDQGDLMKVVTSGLKKKRKC